MNAVNVGCGWRNFGKRYKIVHANGDKETVYWKYVDGGGYDHLDSKNIFLEDFEDNTLDLIYCSHMLEYFDREEAPGLLKSWMKKLKVGGKLYLSVPHFGEMAGMWHQERVPLHRLLGPLYGKMQMGEKTIYHKTVYDDASLGELLRSCGYRRLETWEHSELPWWKKEFDDHSLAKINRGLISLNMCCEKK